MPDRIARVWNGTSWEVITSTAAAANAVAVYQSASPSGPVTGLVWIDSDDKTPYVYTGSAWESFPNLLAYAPVASPTFTGTVNLPTVSISGITTTSNYINRTTVNGNSSWLQQDGTGRTHWYWNTLGGTSPTFTNAAEDASALTLHVNNNGNGGTFFHRSANGASASAGGPITWTTTLYVDLNTITFKGTPIALTSGATFTGTVIAPAATTSISSIRLPHGTAPTSPTNGDIWTTTAGVFARINGATTPLGGATGGGTDQVFYNNDQTVTTNYSIPSGKNSMSAGPVTINNGVTVTIPSGSVWSII